MAIFWVHLTINFTVRIQPIFFLQLTATKTSLKFSTGVKIKLQGPNMTGLREQKKKETRAAIMEAALTLFGERGYEHTSIAALAKAAGIGKGTIYSYFKSKNEILLAFCEE
ncbi:MAG: TetR/AcrR family transcriptional regulator, partial [Candidatus Electrothrix sp. AR3]|nr:TetR/AcrR family transcriptional regulator [Candidatus Electrothrix sp. AR3]